ncbi:MAG: IS1595 family transposase, partial [Gammaproteobacteria bacterium]|nr:IS1595 family transposase [Acidimicrobiaceae bacterium]MYJ73785.1 IS1595 family transposase [Gammaproteobacteria bacterium]
MSHPYGTMGSMSKAHQLVNNGMSYAGFFRLYPDDITAEAQWEAWLWPTGVRCPHCDSDNIARPASRKPMPYRCRTCRKHFSVTSATVMKDSKLGAQTWLLALFLIVSNPKGRSSVQLAADLGITQKSAWHVSHRLRAALADGSLPGFDGPVEVDETYVGGKARNRHRCKADPGKTAVIGVKDRDTGTVAATPVHDVNTGTAEAMVAATTRQGADVFTDGSRVYDGLSEMGYSHQRVIHSIGEYVRGPVSTNGVENYWSGLKRCYIGTYHWWSDEHLHRYVDEHSFRYNRRNVHVT